MINETVIEQRLKHFQDDLRVLEIPVVVQKHITFGDCFILDENAYFGLKAKVAREFGLHPSEVLLVGSGKLGFSIVGKKRYRYFGDTSDIDLALVSPRLFDEIWMEVHSYSRSGAYWPDAAAFKDYLFRGWIRPDKLPPERTFHRRAQWWEFFRTLTASGEFGSYRISAGLYKSWYFLESYQETCVRQCRRELEEP